MTYNPTRYEYPYGIHLLDDIHNLFPEFLYDGGMFPGNQLLTFLQMRTNELFPEEYAHNRSHYRLYQLERRRREAGIPMLAALRNPQTPPRRVQPTRIPATPARPARTTRPERSPQHPQAEVETYTVPLTSLFTLDTTNSLNTLLSAALLSTRQDLNDLLTPVVVAPTDAQIAAASIVSSVEPPTDITCAICQDHEQPLPTNTGWRILRHCSHRFHRSCIDEWFRQNVHCPVCRHDIRNTGTNET